MFDNKCLLLTLKKNDGHFKNLYEELSKCP